MGNKNKVKPITVRIPERKERILRKQAEKANMSLSRYCALLMESEKGELLLEKQELMKTIYELRVKLMVQKTVM